MDDELETLNLTNNGKCKYYPYFGDEESVFSSNLSKSILELYCRDKVETQLCLIPDTKYNAYNQDG